MAIAIAHPHLTPDQQASWDIYRATTDMIGLVRQWDLGHLW